MDDRCVLDWIDCEAWGWEEVRRLGQSLRTRAWSALDHLPPYAPLGVCADLGGACARWTAAKRTVTYAAGSGSPPIHVACGGWLWCGEGGWACLRCGADCGGW